MDKIGGAISFASEQNIDFFGCKAVISKDFSKIAFWCHQKTKKELSFCFL